MLVLTRKPGQSIIIGDGIEVQVLSVAGEKVRLGITAPRDVDIFRDEVYHRIESESLNGSREVESALERLSP
jgi:carbon storage regulator